MSSSSISFEDDGDEAFEHTLLVVREVSVYKIPPRTNSGGYKCGDWLQSDKIWSGRLRVVSCKDRCEIRLEEPNSGDLFAACFVAPGQRESSVETVLDSSRYFVLKIEDGQGKHAFIGLGFGERNEAFDFNVALSDHQKYARRADESSTFDDSKGDRNDEEAQINIHPAVNHRLKEGETIRINVKHRAATSGSGMLSGATVGKKVGLALAPPPSDGKLKPLIAPPPSDGKLKSFIAPPPSDGKLKTLIPPPPNDSAAARKHPVGVAAKDSAFSDMSSLEKSLPGAAKRTSAGWAAF